MDVGHRRADAFDERLLRSVSETLRVVRLNRRMPRRCSSSPIALLNAFVDIPRSRASARKDPRRVMLRTLRRDGLCAFLKIGRRHWHRSRSIILAEITRPLPSARLFRPPEICECLIGPKNEGGRLPDEPPLRRSSAVLSVCSPAFLEILSRRRRASLQLSHSVLRRASAFHSSAWVSGRGFHVPGTRVGRLS
jgi:hypothetical protein